MNAAKQCDNGDETITFQIKLYDHRNISLRHTIFIADIHFLQGKSFIRISIAGSYEENPLCCFARFI